MNKPRFLIDEDTARFLAGALRQKEPAVDIIRVGDPGTPPSGTLDPDLLIAAENLGRVLITQDKRTMPGHLADHFAAGRHTAGVMLLRQGFALSRIVQEILNHWATTTADDWIDRTVYIP
jgi:hypothetical protein